MNILTDTCVVPIAMAYLAIAYIAGSIIYIIATRCIGTPFNDSLSQEQVVLKKRSARTRGMIFGAGFLASLAVLFIWTPFMQCRPSA